jgi:hypothetical protein
VTIAIGGIRRAKFIGPTVQTAITVAAWGSAAAEEIGLVEFVSGRSDRIAGVDYAADRGSVSGLETIHAIASAKSARAAIQLGLEAGLAAEHDDWISAMPGGEAIDALSRVIMARRASNLEDLRR